MSTNPNTYNQPEIDIQVEKEKTRLPPEWIKQMEECCGCSFGRVLFDNEKDNQDGFNFFQMRLSHATKVYVVVESAKGTIFGIYIGEHLRILCTCFKGGYNEVEDTFLFSFKDNIPMKYPKRKTTKTVKILRGHEQYDYVSTEGLHFFWKDLCNVEKTKTYQNNSFDFGDKDYPLVNEIEFDQRDETTIKFKRLFMIEMNEMKEENLKEKKKETHSYCVIV